MLSTAFTTGLALAEDKTGTAVQGQVDWNRNTQNGKVNIDGNENVSGDWGDSTFVPAGSQSANEEDKPGGATSSTTALAILAGIAGALGISVLTGKALSKKEVTSIIPEGNGIWVTEKDREKVEQLINKTASKTYYIDDQGFLKEKEGSAIDPGKSETYSKMLDDLINGDKKVIIGVNGTWDSYNPDDDTITVNGFSEKDGGVTIGDNGTDQVIVISGEDTQKEDVDGEQVYGGAEVTLAHEISHAVRGVYGLKNEDKYGDGVNHDEEAYAIQAENKVRDELGYGLRGDGDKKDDVDIDGVADGDSSYGRYNTDEQSSGWYDYINESMLTEERELSGSIYQNEWVDCQVWHDCGYYGYYDTTVYGYYTDYQVWYDCSYESPSGIWDCGYYATTSVWNDCTHTESVYGWIDCGYYTDCRTWVSYPTIGTPSISVSGGEKNADGTYKPGTTVHITTSCPNADHMGLFVNGNYITYQSGSSVSFDYTIPASGAYNICTKARNTPGENDPGTMLTTSSTVSLTSAYASQIGTPSISISGGEKNADGTYKAGTTIQITTSCPYADHMGLFVNGNYIAYQSGSSASFNYTIPADGTYNICTKARNTPGETDPGTMLTTSSTQTVTAAASSVTPAQGTSNPGVYIDSASSYEILNMINSLSYKQYCIDANGYLMDSGNVSSWRTSTNYSQLIDILISKDKKTTIRIDTSQLDYGMTYGDNGGDQEIVLNGYPDSDLKNIDGYAIPGDPMFILAHEMRHAVRAENGVRDSNPDAIAAEANEEAYAILFENMVRNEASPDYGLRGDGDPLDDVDEDGIPDGDGNYGNYDEFYTIGGESDDSYLFITRNLCIGMKGSDVIQLQKNLNKLGYNCGTPTGIFDENTKAAVLAFQKAKGLGQDGIAGTQTRRAINIALQGTGNPTSALIFQSERKKGLDQYGNQANDMKTNDFTKEQLLAINSLFQYQIDEASNSETLFTEFKNMSTQLFSQGEMETVILDMINHFKGGGGTDYSNATLTAQVSAHPTTQAYIQLVKDEFMKDLVLHGGILSDLQFNEATKLTNPLYNYIISNANYPVFNSWADTLGGLKITVNDTWGNNIEVKNYTKDGNKLTGTLHFTIYDHFGLDQPDVEPKYVNIGGVTVEVNFATIAGFRAWYVLQHYNQFNGQYKPFATVMEIDVPFETYLVGSGGQA